MEKKWRNYLQSSNLEEVLVLLLEGVGLFSFLVAGAMVQFQVKAATLIDSLESGRMFSPR